MQLGLENKKKAKWLAVLGPLALLLLAYEIFQIFPGSAEPAASSAQAAAPLVSSRAAARSGGKPAKKVRAENLDPTLRLDLLASSEQTQYEGNGRNIFVSQAEIEIPKPMAPGSPDALKAEAEKYHTPAVPPPTPIPLKFFGFASTVGESKKIFLSSGEDVWVAAEGEIVDRRYKVIHISPTSVEMQDVVNSGPSQNIPLTPG